MSSVVRKWNQLLALLILWKTKSSVQAYLQYTAFTKALLRQVKDKQHTVLLLSDANNDYQSDWSSDFDKGENWEDQSNNNWSSFESSNDESMDANTFTDDVDIDNGEVFLDTIASISADEISFMNTEADRADKVRQMQEWGFEANTIANTLDVAIDDSAENPDNEVFQTFQEETAKSGFGMYNSDIDLMTVESHTTVEVDEETGEPIRSQMVYVDEHTCIGCTNCATVAQSTFFMEEDMGRARVFDQWGDNDETIQIAIETCPVDCIHYVPYEELKRLEVLRRKQNINFKGRLVNQDDTFVPTGFTAAPKISGNMKSRCNNCPTNGCKNCPMYGVGKNPAFEKKEKERLARAAKRKMKDQLDSQTKSADL
mmetsp:Transcript_13724/g.20910  ORF Transcript_13724/g.20910 Transcript_13724/m.20910 type:complete len:370 (-) Transcript_13724:104-1213(-)